jgi:hypothetical protein
MAAGKNKPGGLFYETPSTGASCQCESTIVSITVDGQTLPKIKRGKEDSVAEKDGQETIDKPTHYGW